MHSESDDALKQAIGILNKAKQSPYKLTDEEKTVQTVEALIGEKSKAEPIDISKPEYRRLAKIVAKLTPLQEQLAEKHEGEDEWTEVLRKEYVKPRADSTIPSQKVALILGKQDGKMYIRTELLDFITTDKESLREAVQLTSQGDSFYSTELMQLVNNNDNQRISQAITTSSLIPPKERVTVFYKHIETIVPPTPLIEQGKKFMRRVFKR